ncbi:adenylate isopentenyltransferase 5, chloroplastic-like [Rhododendron vialii]|uniref:adenylate isopentenyltransferase 5, chloroplastic-like n=1 Tax=Rhododendron vialii TaxID=182163 RepID=UPI00265F860C|nr:adenylate isopentenyltransferase 5, chloroplastic-like [Rhododendron vialii]
MNFHIINSHAFNKKKVVFIMGATGTGKTRLSLDLAAHFPAEIINSDKIQVYKGLDIVTNKVSEMDRRGVAHHLLGEVDPETDFMARDFCLHALKAIDMIVRSGKVPIVIGGSNSYIEALVEEHFFKFKRRYDCCFLWADVVLPVLNSFVSKRVDEMVSAGLVEEVRGMFMPGADYTRGIRRAIGVPELDSYFRAEMMVKMDEKSKEVLLRAAIDEIKTNTHKLVLSQSAKIQRLKIELGWLMHRLDVTPVFEKCGDEADREWEKVVLGPSLEIVGEFLNGN